MGVEERGAEIGRGTKVFEAAPVRGAWRMLDTPDDVLELMDTSAEGVVACVADAGATFLAPIFDELDRGRVPVGHAAVAHRHRRAASTRCRA